MDAERPSPSALSGSRAHARTWPYLAGLLVFCVASRLPQLLSPNLLVDGDEAVVGLMAKHLRDGTEFPFFFWGQHYGLATFEAAAGALAFSLFGTGAIALKLAMLALWTAGVVFLFFAARHLVGPRRGFWIVAVFVLMPAWAVWSMKARGGYITSFTVSSALLFLLTRDPRRLAAWWWAAAGVLTVIIYLAQPLWLPMLVPIVLVVLFWRDSLVSAGVYAAVVGSGVFLITSSGGPQIGNCDVFGSVRPLVHQLYLTLTGVNDFYWDIAPPGPVTSVSAVCWYALLLATVPMQLYRLSRKRYLAWSHLLFLSTLCTIGGELVLLNARDARYLLSFAAPLVMLVGVEVSDLLDRGLLPKLAASAATAAILALGAVTMVEMRNFTFLWANPPGSLTEAQRINRVLTYLQVQGVHDVFSMNGLLDTQLMFYSDEHVIARSMPLFHRHAAYVEEVDRAFAAGEAVAVVGYTDNSGAPGCFDVPICSGDIAHMVDPRTIYTVDGKYFVYAGADRALLQRLHFDLPN